jgi:hypothetical protein
MNPHVSLQLRGRVRAAPTYSTAVWSSSYGIVLELQVRVEDGCVEGNFAIEATAELLPVSCRFRHDMDLCIIVGASCLRFKLHSRLELMIAHGRLT